MKNRFAVAGFGLAVCLVAAVSCSKELTSISDLTDEEIRKQAAKDSAEARKKFVEDSVQAVRDSLLREGGRVVYTVQIVDGGKAAFGGGASTDGGTSSSSSAGVGGVKVTTTQLNKSVTVTTDPTGMAVFPDMRVGKVAVEVDDDTYTPVSFTAELTAPPEDLPPVTAQDITRNASTRVPVFPLTGAGTTSVSGLVTLETDLTNGAAEIGAGIGISASITTDAAFIAKYVDNGGEASGKVLTITYKNAISSTTTSSGGVYSLTLPATASGLNVALHLSDVAANQTLLLNTLNGQEVFGTQSVRTLFTQAAGVVPTTIPAVRPAYIDFAPPAGAGINQPPVVAATASAVISSGNVVSMNITDAGRGYTQAPSVVFSSASGTGATGTVTLTNGRVTGLAVATPGTGYVNGDGVSLVSTGTGATAVADISREVTGITVTGPGTGYSAAPTVSITGGGGSGATATANVLGSVNTINLTDAGSNFTTVPTAQITGGGGSGATASVTLTGGPIRQINVPSNANQFYTTASPAVVITGTGTGAAATANASGPGRIQNVAVSTAGSGYTVPPNVVFTGGGGSGAIAIAVLDNSGGIASINILNPGDGYTSVPTVTLTGGTGGSGATLGTVTLERRISSVTLTSAGTNYTTASVTIGGFSIPNTQVLLNRSIASINVITGGANYTSTPTVTIFGDGIGGAGIAQLKYFVGSISVTNPGGGYKSAPTVTLTGDGTGATATATLGNGILSGVTITNPGSGYTAPPNFIFTGGGAVTEQAVVVGTVSGGRVTGATITSLGKGYTANPAITLSTFLAGATANANIETGTVVAVNITNPGLGYKGVPVIQFSSATGSGAAATAVLDAQGRVAAINITASGSNYATAPALDIVVPNSATRARGVVTVNSQGVVTGVTVTNVGEGYTSAPTATITPAVTGKGSGAIVEVRVANGIVTGVVVVNGGSGYLGQNTPGNFFPVSGAAVAGQGYRFSQPSGATLTLRSGVAVVNDIFLGTGTRQVP